MSATSVVAVLMLCLLGSKLLVNSLILSQGKFAKKHKKILIALVPFLYVGASRRPCTSGIQGKCLHGNDQQSMECPSVYNKSVLIS